MDRRQFLGGSGALLGAAMLPLTAHTATVRPMGQWEDFRSLFPLDRKLVHLTQMLLASHPKPVQDAIDLHRRKLNENPTEYVEENLFALERRARESAAKYIQADADEIMMTDSTTMGLGLLYSGWKLKPSEEVLTTTHDHYATEKSLEYAAQKNGASVRRISLYDDPAKTDEDQIAERIAKGITANTRVVAITWVHSVTGVKLPVRRIADTIKTINQQRDESGQIFLCVDGVHAFGVENVTMADLGCDCFVAGTHKWIFGPRGTGIAWVAKRVWDQINPTIPAFSETSYGMWMGAMPKAQLTFSDLHTPGGFHSFEHRWALNEAFDLLLKTGKANIHERTHELNRRFKNGLKSIRHITLHTPVSDALSAGINCFEVHGMKPAIVLEKLRAKNIITSTTPYRLVYNRVTPSVLNTEEEVDRCIQVLEKIRE